MGRYEKKMEQTRGEREAAFKTIMDNALADTHETQKAYFRGKKVSTWDFYYFRKKDETLTPTQRKYAARWLDGFARVAILDFDRLPEYERKAYNEGLEHWRNPKPQQNTRGGKGNQKRQPQQKQGFFSKLFKRK